MRPPSDPPAPETDARALVLRHWACANARDWDGFAALLHPALRYEVPQTREYAEGAQGYLEVFRTWPGHWVATVRELVCEPRHAVCRIDFAVGTETMTGISFIDVEDGRIRRVTDWWPDPYDPPPRSTPMLRRRPA